MASGEPNSQDRGRSPCVSVIIPVYNGAATIDRALKSVFDQTFTDYEVVICDDGSTDGTRALIERYRDRVRLIEQSNSGPAAARNNGARHSSGGYLAFLDADDVWTPQFVERSVAALDADRSLSLVYCDCALADSEGVALDTSLVGHGFDHPPSLNELLTQLWPIRPSAALVRREAFDRAGGFCEQLISAEDIHFWLLMREQGPFLYLPEKLVRFTHGRLYPKVLNRDIGPTAIVDLIRARYGTRADSLVKNFIRHRVRMIANAGVIEMSRGNMEGARRCFIRVLKYDPLYLKSYTRIARTFLPSPLRRALGGKASRGAERDS